MDDINNVVADEAEGHVSRTLYLCKLPLSYSEAELYKICSSYGNVKKLACYPSRQIAFVEYWDLNDAQQAKNGLKDTCLNGRTIDVQYSKKEHKEKTFNTGTLYVRPLTTERYFYDPNTLTQYQQLFSQFGEIKKITTNRKREAEKFVEYYDLQAAEVALENLNGSNFNGIQLEVQFANQSSKQQLKENQRNRSNRLPDNENDKWPFAAVKYQWLGFEGPSAQLKNEDSLSYM